MKNKNKKIEWEKDFEKFNNQWEKEGYLAMDDLEDFIRTLLQKEKAKERERVLKELREIEKIPSDYLDFKTKFEKEEKELMIKVYGREKFEVLMTGRREMKSAVRYFIKKFKAKLK